MFLLVYGYPNKFLCLPGFSEKLPMRLAFEISSNVICFILLSPLLVSAKAVINTGPQNQFLIYKKPPPAKNHFVLCQGRVYFYTRGATLFCDCSHALQNTIIFLATNVCLHVTEYSDGFPLFPVPSVVHLLIRFLSGFHLPGLSVSALPTLSPLHRFRSIYFFLMRCIIVPFFFAVK